MTLILEVFGEDLPASERMLQVIRATFERYGTHELPDPLPPPPEVWRRPFEAAVRDLGIRTNDIVLAHRKLNEYVAGLGRSPS